MEVSNSVMTIRLVVSLIFGGLIGLERESHGRPAGFRTHILVCVGSTLVMLVSAYGFQHMWDPPKMGYDPGRIAAQVISGIGFLGAGTIMREGANIRGLTTAASLWIVAAIGLAVGIGMYYPAMIATGLVVLTLVVLSRIEQPYSSDQYQLLTIQALDVPGRLADIFAVLAKHNVDVRNIDLKSGEDGQSDIQLSVELPSKLDRANLIENLVTTNGINRAMIE